ncbi:nucleoside deaminase [Nocardioides caldifontis]|uniref:nucleoside deaminase n=1 Tax=Nocardioides caldifontis TaxID=2588938 RepID=UPI0011E03374|nr:nucleoside deaminase [Nocardioides caldifontis]
MTSTTLSEKELRHLRRAIELAEEALEAGDQPFGSVLVDADGQVLFEDRNRANSVDVTRHPEFEIARWAAANLTPEQRAGCVVYTSGEHCAMCSSAHARAGLGPIVFVISGKQLERWLAEWGVPPAPVATLSINDVAPEVQVTGPVPELVDEVKELIRRRHQER